MDLFEWLKNKGKQLLGDNEGAFLDDRVFKQTTDRTWEHVVVTGLPRRYMFSHKVPEDVREEVLRWINSEEYNVDPIGFLKEYETFMKNYGSGGEDNVMYQAYQIVKYYTTVFFKLNIDDSH